MSFPGPSRRGYMGPFENMWMNSFLSNPSETVHGTTVTIFKFLEEGRSGYTKTTLPLWTGSKGGSQKVVAHFLRQSDQN